MFRRISNCQFALYPFFSWSQTIILHVDDFVKRIDIHSPNGSCLNIARHSREHILSVANSGYNRQAICNTQRRLSQVLARTICASSVLMLHRPTTSPPTPCFHNHKKITIKRKLRNRCSRPAQPPKTQGSPPSSSKNPPKSLPAPFLHTALPPLSHKRAKKRHSDTGNRTRALSALYSELTPDESDKS